MLCVWSVKLLDSVCYGSKVDFRSVTATVPMTMLVRWCCLYREVLHSFLIAADVLQYKAAVVSQCQFIP